MDVEISYRPAYSLGIITLGGNEEVRVEGGSMVAMSAASRWRRGRPAAS
jgi:uncharacterized protein (AIM24 family)